MFIARNVKIESIYTFKEALRAIKTYIYLQEWHKAKSALEDVKEKEKAAFTELEEKIKDNYREIQKQRKIYEKNLRQILKIERDYEIRKIKYERIVEGNRFKIRFTKIRQEVKRLISAGQNNDALNLLTHFLEENKERSDVVTYYAKEKKKVLKNIRKKQSSDKRKIRDNAEIEAIKLAGITLRIRK